MRPEGDTETLIGPDPRSLRLARGAAQLLGGAGRSAAEIVGRVLAVQAQDLRAARLALRARGAGSAADVDRALSEERSLVVGWLGRGTLHLVRAEDYPWLLALTAPAQFAGSRRRLGQEGVPPDDAERAVAVVERALADEGPLTRAELAARIAAQGIRVEGQSTPHLLRLAALRGVAVLGPLQEGAQAYVLARDWLGAAGGSSAGSGAGAAPRDRALAELARRYLRGHGPAAAADLAAWVALPLRDAHAGLGAIAGELVELEGGLVDLAARDPRSGELPPRLLPAFDPYLLGWRDRGFAVPPEHARRVHPGGGVLRAVATVDGLAVGTWSVRRGRVELDPFGALGEDDAAALRADAEAVSAYLA